MEVGLVFEYTVPLKALQPPRFQVGNQSGMGQELIRSLTERYEP